jgi:effector-binding domain-containing protein
MASIEVGTIGPQAVAYLGMTGAYSQIPSALAQLYEWIVEHKLEPAGMPECVYHTSPSDDEATAIWEVRVPVSDDPQPLEPDEDGFGVRVLPSRLVAATLHHGPYETLEVTYGELMSWIAANGYHVAGPPEEVYFSDPAEVSPDDHLTEIRLPVSR